MSATSTRQPSRPGRHTPNTLVGALAGVLLASALALLAGADPAVAHATLVGTLPAADVMIDAVPELVELRFDEAVEVVDDAVRVFGPDGDRVDLADVEVDGGVGRWLGFAGTFVAVGAAALALAAGRVDERVRRRVRPLAVSGAAVAAVGVLLALVAMVAESAGRGLVDAIDLVPDLAPDTRTGRLALARAGLCLAAAVTAALAGHAWTAPSRGLAVATDVIHLAAVALWIGGLVALLVALPVSTDRSRLAARFSAGPP